MDGMDDTRRAEALELARQLTDDPATFREAEFADRYESDRCMLLLASGLVAAEEELERVKRGIERILRGDNLRKHAIRWGGRTWVPEQEYEDPG